MVGEWQDRVSWTVGRGARGVGGSDQGGADQAVVNWACGGSLETDRGADELIDLDVVHGRRGGGVGAGVEASRAPRSAGRAGVRGVVTEAARHAVGVALVVSSGAGGRGVVPWGEGDAGGRARRARAVSEAAVALLGGVLVRLAAWAVVATTLVVATGGAVVVGAGSGSVAVVGAVRGRPVEVTARMAVVIGLEAAAAAILGGALKLEAPAGGAAAHALPRGLVADEEAGHGVVVGVLAGQPTVARSSSLAQRDGAVDQGADAHHRREVSVLGEFLQLVLHLGGDRGQNGVAKLPRRQVLAADASGKIPEFLKNFFHIIWVAIEAKRRQLIEVVLHHLLRVEVSRRQGLLDFFGALLTREVVEAELVFLQHRVEVALGFIRAGFEHHIPHIMCRDVVAFGGLRDGLAEPLVVVVLLALVRGVRVTLLERRKDSVNSFLEGVNVRLATFTFL